VWNVDSFDRQRISHLQSSTPPFMLNIALFFVSYMFLLTSFTKSVRALFCPSLVSGHAKGKFILHFIYPFIWASFFFHLVDTRKEKRIWHILHFKRWQLPPSGWLPLMFVVQTGYGKPKTKVRCKQCRSKVRT